MSTHRPEDKRERVEINGLTYIAETIYTRPNRAQRRAAGIRYPLHVLDAYNAALREIIPPADGE